MNTKFPTETDGQQRRLVLKGALATCAALALPSLAGCGKREEPPPPAPATDMTPPPAPPQMEGQTVPPAPEGGAKMSKEQVQYQEQPKGDQKCSTCNNFIAESNTCKVVEGPINPEGWCTLWVLKQG